MTNIIINGLKKKKTNLITNRIDNKFVMEKVQLSKHSEIETVIKTKNIFTTKNFNSNRNKTQKFKLQKNYRKNCQKKKKYKIVTKPKLRLRQKSN